MKACASSFFFPLYKHDLRTEWKTNLFDTEQRAGFSCDSICGPLFSFAFVVLAHHDIFCPFSLPALFLCLTTQLKKKKKKEVKNRQVAVKTKKIKLCKLSCFCCLKDLSLLQFYCVDHISPDLFCDNSFFSSVWRTARRSRAKSVSLSTSCSHTRTHT